MNISEAMVECQKIIDQVECQAAFLCFSTEGRVYSTCRGGIHEICGIVGVTLHNEQQKAYEREKRLDAPPI